MSSTSKQVTKAIVGIIVTTVVNVGSKELKKHLRKKGYM